jgi:hypothetical protein
MSFFTGLLTIASDDTSYKIKVLPLDKAYLPFYNKKKPPLEKQSIPISYTNSADNIYKRHLLVNPVLILWQIS